MNKRSLADLKVGEKAKIESFTDTLVSLKLLEMGCLPQSEVCLKYKAPLGDPICIEVAGYQLSLRKHEARSVLLV